MKSRMLLLAGLLSLTAAHAQKTAKEMVAAMTLDEKVNLVVGMGMNIPGMTNNTGPVIGQTMDKVPGAAGTTFAISRLNLPNTVLADGPAGLRIEPKRKDDPNTYFATAWPVATLLASSWDTKLVTEVGKAMGNEVKEYGVDVILAPGMNIHRNPLGGRNFEYYSEDPLIAGKMAAAMVKGIQSNGVGTSVKHFAGNSQETNRNVSNSIVGERALREIYLKGFEIVVKEAQPWTVMSSYNFINGKYTSEDYDLLTTILRKEWGFKGLVMTDWFGGTNPVAQMKAGNDLLMPGTSAQKKAITEAIKSGELDMKVLDENAERIVNYILVSPAYKKYKFSNKPDLVAHAALARRAASEGMVLLKNETSALPLATDTKKLAVFGNTSYEFISGGTGSGDVNEAYTVSLVEGLSKAGYQLDEEIKTAYQNHMSEYWKKHPKGNFFQEFMNPTPPPGEYAVDPGMLTKKAAEDDLALITIGRNAGEGRDRKVENDFNLSEAEQTMIQNVAEAFHAARKKVVVVLNVGGVIETVSWRDKVDAILLAWQPGLEAGNAVTDVLAGKVNPSGKLASTFPVKYEDVSSAANFPGKEFPEKATAGMFGMKQIPTEVTYEEGIYVGYRYFNTFRKPTAYEFGFGGSYTSFNFGDYVVSPVTNGKVTVKVKVTNTGKSAGREVVQLYTAAPSGGLDKPAEELRSFAKTALLKPGQSEVITMTVDVKDLASYNPASASWIVDAGAYAFKIGTSSEKILHTATVKVPATVVAFKAHSVMLPQVPIKEIKLKAF